MSNQPEPNWQPITALPMFANVIEGVLESNQEQYQTLLPAKEKPWVLDDALVARVLHAFETQRDDLGLFEEQFARWQKTPLTRQQQKEVTRLIEQLAKIKEINAAVLALANELKENTIEQVLGKDDLQLGLDFLSGKLKP